MTTAQYFKNLDVPSGKIDVVLDTDAYNEVDDQYAIAYMLSQTISLTFAEFAPLLSTTINPLLPRTEWKKAMMRS